MLKKDDLQVKSTKKFILYFILSCVVWVLLLGFIPSPIDDLIMLSIPILFLWGGLLAGFFLKTILLDKPWIVLIIPFVYLLYSIFV